MDNKHSVLRGTCKRLVAFVLVLFMLFSTFPVISFQDGKLSVDSGDSPASMKADAAQITSGNGTWISGKLTYAYSVTTGSDNKEGAAGSVSASGGTLTVKATSAKQYDTGGCNSTTVAAAATTTTVTVTNASSYPLKFTSLSTTGSASVAGVSQGDTIASGATFTVTVTSPANGTNATEKSGTVTISVSEETSVTITLKPSPYVGYTVNGKTVAQNGSDQTFSVDVGTNISLPSITAPSGYEFKGWRIGSNLVNANNFTADAGYDVFPVIVTAGTDTTSANFKVGSTTYTFWEDAVTAAAGGVIYVNATEVSLPNNVLDNLLPASGGTFVKPVTGGGVEYILPAGVTLVVPYSTSTTVHTTKPAYDYKQRVAPSPFRTMTVPNGAKITVNGAVSVDSFVCAYGQSNQGNGTPSGPHGKIVMKSGSEMTFNSGANLYCYGYINGDGNIYMKSGATAYELFQFCDWRGGNGTNNIEGNSQRVFPMSQYYVQNVEAPMTLYKGATEKVWSVVNMSSSPYPTDQIEFIGSNGMFKLTGGDSDYLTKRFHANIDQLEIKVHGNMTVNKLNVKVTGLPLIGSITMDSSDYVLPINNMNIVVDSGTTSIASNNTYGIEFLPSSKLTVNSGATFNVNAPVYFYDADDWGGYVGASNLKLVVSGYDTANGTTAIRTADNLKDAELNVNGTVTVSNKLYTTEHGAHITSSEGTGQIQFSTACATGTAITYQATQSGTSISAYPQITCNNAWLLNGDESYSETVGTGTSTWKYDKDGEHWYRYLVDFVYGGNTIKRDYYCENGDTITYDASWLANLGATASNGTADIDGTNVNVTDVTSDSVVTLTGVPAEYKPTFVLSEEEYTKHYLLYNSTELTNTTTINGETYYIVDQASSAEAVGTPYTAPTDAAMGVSAENHNDFIWNLSGISFTSGDPYRGTVPAGATAGGPAYIYGFYSGVVAHNSWNDTYYSTLAGAFEVLPQDVSATITLLADCGTFEEESGTEAYATYTANNITLDLNGHHALGRIVNAGTFTLELNGGTFDFHTGSTAISANYKTLAAVTNKGTMTIQDSAGGGVVVSDATSNSSGSDGTAVIRNNKDATLTITGKDKDHNLTLLENQHEVAYNSTYGYYAYNYGIYNLGRITALTDVDITTAHSRTTGVNVYNYNTGVIDNITRGHMYSYSGSSVFNYGGTITTIDSLNIDGKNGITNRNIRGGSAAAGWTVAASDIGTITTIQNCDIEVGQYAIYNHARIATIHNCTLVGQPDSAQVDTRGNGLSTASDGNAQCYTVYNSNEWWYNSYVWKQVDSSSGGYTRVNYYKEDEEYRPTIGTITDCEIYAYNTSTSASYGQYAFLNYGVINSIGGTTNIKAEKHPDNAKAPITHYAFQNLTGGIVKSIEGTVNISATGVGAVYNSGQFTTQINYTYANKVGGNITYQKETYGQPSTINSITCSGTWSCGAGSSYYYALMNAGYIDTINSTGLTLEGGYNVLYNTTGGVNSTYEITKKYTDGATASTEYERVTHYVKNLTKGSTINTINGITVKGKGTKSYYPFNNQGHIGTLSNATVTFVDGATANTTYYAAMLNGDSRYKEYTETIRTNRTSETDPLLTVSAGIATRYDRDYTYDTPTIDVIDNLTVNSMTLYAMRNAGHIGTLKNSTITGTQYALHNYNTGPYTERQTVQYYSGTGIFTTTKSTSEYAKHYKRNPATINLIDNCTITTPANTYAMFNGGHVGTIKNSTLQAGTTTAKAYALYNGGSSTIVGTDREYTLNLEDYFYVTANGGTACTAYWATNGETKVVTYDYEAPVIDLIGEGNTFKATNPVIANTGKITEINSGEGELTTITGSSSKGSSIYNFSACLDARTTTTPYTAAASAGASGTAGTAVNEDTLLSGAEIGTIKNVYINANGYGILNGDASTGKTPTIGEIGEGTEIYAHCTTAGYHAVYNQANAKVTGISGGVYTVTKATTNAYKNNNTAEGYSTQITGGDFKGMSATRANAIYEPDNANRQTYPGYVLSSDSHSVDFNNGTAVASGTGYYYLCKACTVSFDKKGHGDDIASQTVLTGQKATKPASPAANAEVTEGEYKYRFDGWYTDDTYETAFNFNSEITGDTTIVAKWTKVCTVTWMNGTTAITTTEADSGTKPTYSGATPTKTATAQYTYTFAGWATEANQETGTAVADLPAVTEDVTYYAAFSKSVNSYTITWKNDDGTTINTTTVEYGQTPTHADPSKDNTAEYTYTFTGWTPAISSVTGDETYTATYSSVKNKYTISFVNDDDSLLASYEVEYGTKPNYAGATPTKDDDSQHTYTFSGWTPEIVTVTGTATYKAVYTSANRSYTITWKNDDGTTIDTTTVLYGVTPTHADATKDSTVQYDYTFTGWTPTIVPVTGEAEYTAQFTQTLRKYNVQWTVESGSAPTEEEIKATVDAIIMNHAASIYSAAQAEGGEAWSFLPHVQNVEYYLLENYFGGGSTADTLYIANKIVAIQENNASINATAESKWNEAKDTIVEKLLSSHDLLNSSEIADLNAANAGTTVTVIDTDQVEYGTTPEYTGETPTKASTAEYSYTFSGWTPAISPVTGDATYTAQFTSEKNSYTITWKNDDGSTIDTSTVEYGVRPTHDDPTKDPDDQYSYTFMGWSANDSGNTVIAELPEVTGEATYYAVFAKTLLDPKHSVSLDGDLGVNFYIPKDYVTDASSAKIKMSWGPESGPDHGKADFIITDLSDDKKTDDDGYVYVFEENEEVNNTVRHHLAKARNNGSFYQATALVAAKQMTDVITVEIYQAGSDEPVLTDTYTVADYCYEVIENADGAVYEKMRAADSKMTEESFEKLQTLCKSMLTYGSRAQTQFDYHTELLANVRIDSETGEEIVLDYTPAAVDASTFSAYYKRSYLSHTDYMKFYGASMLLESETTYSLWYSYTDSSYEPPEAIATIDGVEYVVECEKVEGNYDGTYYVRYNILNIPAEALTKDITVTFEGEEPRTFNAQSYFYLAMRSGDEKLINTVTALYDYSMRSVDYFDSRKEEDNS